jgi:hypothetical protein
LAGDQTFWGHKAICPSHNREGLKKVPKRNSSYLSPCPEWLGWSVGANLHSTRECVAQELDMDLPDHLILNPMAVTLSGQRLWTDRCGGNYK